MSVTAMPKTSAAPAAEAAEEPKKSKKKLIIIVLVVLLVAGGGYYKFGRGGSKGPVKPVAGAVVKLDPIQVNLAGEHYLRIGIALQMTDKAEAEVDGSKALDATIAEFSGKTIAQVNAPDQREKLKETLLKELEHLYEETVMGLYFTEFVTQ